MSFLAPVFLGAGAAVAGAIVLLHFLARRRPRPAVLPTARFVPDRPARWPSLAPRPSDWLLLALRVFAIVVIAAGFARPVRAPERAVTTRIVLVDRSQAVADERAIRDSALAVLGAADVLIAFDTMTRVVSTGARDTAAALTRSAAPPSLSAALIAAERAAVSLRDRADSIELAIVSPFADESWDHATSGLRRRWAGRVRLVSLPLARGDTGMRAVEVHAPASDPVHAAAAPFALAGESRTRVVRGVPSAEDSAWATAAGHVLVHWSRAPDSLPSTAEAVVAHGVVLAAPLVRRGDGDVDRTRVIARFADGAPAVVERRHGAGCIRDVRFDLPAAGDVPLRESTRRMIGVVAAPCEHDQPRQALTAARMDSLRGAGPLLATPTLPRPPRQRSPAAPWLLIGGALLLMVEVSVRQRAVRA